MKVEILFLEGDRKGERVAGEVGHWVLGREPGRDGLELPGDDTVSRRHGELFLEGGRLAYRNLSANGSFVNDKRAEHTTLLAARDRLRLGAATLLEVQFGSAATLPLGTPRSVAAQTGPLTRPAVRILLGGYLFALLLLGVYLAVDSDADDRRWDEARSAYAGYTVSSVSESEKASRLDRADALVRSLRALERRDRSREARIVCAELMAIDADPASPIYRFGARCSGANSD